MNSTSHSYSVFAFVDEAGDTGLKIGRGSSRCFTIAIVIFTEDDEMRRCDKIIDDLRCKQDKSKRFEFHFHNNNRQVREAFLAAVSSVGFIYYAFTLDKSLNHMWGEAYKSRDSFYMMVSKYVFESARPHLQEAFVVIDESGSQAFQDTLAKYIRNIINADDGKVIRKMRAERSSQNNLLQLADYVASICHRVSLGKADAEQYHKQISLKEIQFKKWPK